MQVKTYQDTTNKSLQDYLSLVETIAKIEYNRMPSNHLIEYAELVNIGAFTVYTVLKANKKVEHNISYMSTAIKWSIRNELRRRYKWYSSKNNPSNYDNDNELSEYNKEEIREALYKTILSIDEMAENNNHVQMKDLSASPDENLEFRELQQHIKIAMNKLNSREKKIIYDRFFENKKLKDLTEEYQISASRVSRIIQTALDKIKTDLKDKYLV